VFIRLSVGREQLGSHWTDFHEIWYLVIFRKSAENNQVTLKSEKNDGNSTWRTIYINDNISLNSFILKNVLGKICTAN
jgi:hypothetical protein